MALKAVLDSIDDLDEGLKSNYKAQKIGDKDVFVLDIEGIDNHPGTKGLKATLEKERKEHKETKAKLKDADDKVKDVPEGFTTERWEQLVALEEAGANNPELKKLKETYDSQIANLKNAHKTEISKVKSDTEATIAAKDTIITGTRNARANDKLVNDLTQELVKSGVKPELLKAAIALHQSKFKHEFEEDGSARTFRSTDTGEQSVTEFVSSWTGSDEGKAFIAPASGGGASGGGGGGGGGNSDNPFTKQYWNKTKQSQVYSTDKVKAERLAKSAGFANLSVAIAATSAIQDK